MGGGTSYNPRAAILNEGEGTLPEFILPTLARIEAERGDTLEFQEDPEIQGHMAADFEGWVVWYRPGLWTSAGVAEEILHLGLRIEGYPTISGPNSCSGFRAATLLSNLLDHQIIYPELEAAGYFPWVSERTASMKRLACFQGENLFLKSEFRAELTMELVRMEMASMASGKRGRKSDADVTIPEVIFKEVAEIASCLRDVGPQTSKEEACVALLFTLMTLRLTDQFCVVYHLKDPEDGKWVMKDV